MKINEFDEFNRAILQYVEDNAELLGLSDNQFFDISYDFDIDQITINAYEGNGTNEPKAIAVSDSETIRRTI